MSSGKITHTCDSQLKECEDEITYYEKLFAANVSPNVKKLVEDGYGHIMDILDASNVSFSFTLLFC